MQFETVYLLKDGVQVRDETFGLLFYQINGPRLYFVPSQDLIRSRFFEGRQRLGELIDDACVHTHWPRSWIQNRVGQVLEMLERKGLIHGQSVC